MAPSLPEDFQTTRGESGESGTANWRPPQYPTAPPAEQIATRARRMSRAFALQVCGVSTGLVTRRIGALRETRRAAAPGRAAMTTAGAVRSDAPTPAPAFRFGLLADIQYVDMEDKCNFTGTQWRRYRNSLVVADRAMQCSTSTTSPSCCTTATTSTTSARSISIRTRSSPSPRDSTSSRT